MTVREVGVRWFGVSWYRHPQAAAGPLVWTLLIRVGRKKKLL